MSKQVSYVALLTDGCDAAGREAYSFTFQAKDNAGARKHLQAWLKKNPAAEYVRCWRGTSVPTDRPVADLEVGQ